MPQGGRAVSLSRRGRRTLREMERNLIASDPRLDDFFLSFTLRTRRRKMPRAERIRSWPFRMLARLWRGGSMQDRVRDWRAEDWIDP
jgi:Protein of unknown function (DUF3040)